MVDEKERERYCQLMDVIGWFFFDLFILGYVEDPNTGKSFRLPGGLKWAVYIEVGVIPFEHKINENVHVHVHLYVHVCQYSVIHQLDNNEILISTVSTAMLHAIIVGARMQI